MYGLEQLRSLPEDLASGRERIRRMRPTRELLHQVADSLRTTRRILEGLVATGTAEEQDLARRALEDLVRSDELLTQREHDADLVQARQDIDNLNMEVFLQYLAGPEPELRIRCALHAAEIEFEATIPHLKGRLQVEKDPHATSAMVKAVGLLGRDDELGWLLPWLGHDDPRVRANAVEGMARMERPQRLESVRTLLDDDAHRPRLAAALTLEAFEPGTVATVVSDLLGWPEPRARLGGLWAAKGLEPDLKRQALHRGLSDGDGAVALRALEYLGACDDLETAQLLLQVMAAHPPGSTFYEAVKDRIYKLQGSTVTTVQNFARHAVSGLMDTAASAAASDSVSDSVSDPDLTEVQPGTLPPGSRRLHAPTGPAPERKEQPLLIRLVGRVVAGPTKEGLKQVTVRVSNSGFQEITDPHGRFYMERLLGNHVYTFVCEKSGWPTTGFRYRTSGQRDQSVLIRMRNKGG